jgi:amidase
MARNLILLLLASVLLAACGRPVVTQTPTTTTQEPTAAATAAQEPTVMQDSTAAPSASAESEADIQMTMALYQQYINLFGPMLTACPKASYPRPDPPVSVKRPLDFSPFSAALDGFSPEQAASIDTAIDGKTVPEIQSLLADGQLSSEQLVLSYIERIQRYDEGRLNSVMELNPEALTIAQSLDAERAAGKVRGPLHGIPVLLKDNIATAGPMHTTAGNYALKDWQADRDAFLVQQLREAGAVIMGKNNLSEWANYTDPCMPSGFSALGGQTRNPHGPYDTLGSSSGSAASVAAELTTVSVGSETAGSLLQPARINGVVGMRPSKGLVSGDYIIPLEPTLDTAGPMGHSVTDVAVLLTALVAASDPRDPSAAGAVSLAGTDFTQYLSLDEARKVRVGVVQFDTSISAALKQSGVDFAALKPEEQQEALDLAGPFLQGATQPVIAALKKQGIEVVLIKESELSPSLSAIHAALVRYGFNDGVRRFFSGVPQPAPISSLADAVAIVNQDAAARAPYGQRHVEDAATTTITAEQYAAAGRGARQIAEQLLAADMQAYGVDVLMFGSNYTTFGPLGVPALSLPVALNTSPFAAQGEPTAVYITGPHLADAKLIAVAYALEQALGVRLTPDLEATVKQIDAVTGR